MVGVLSVGALAACGTSDDGEQAKVEVPTTVRAEDLARDGTLWRSLTPDLKDTLIGLGKDRLAAERPDGASGIRAYDTAKLVVEVDKQYTNESKRSRSIYETFRSASDRMAHEELDDIFNQMGELCAREDAPEECGS